MGGRIQKRFGAIDAPEHGPRIVFFTGGTALKETSQVLKRYTHNTIHIMTPFDSGGSSAELRRTLHMLSVGDLRNRLVALADESDNQSRAVLDFVSARLASDERCDVLRGELLTMSRGRHPLVEAIPLHQRQVICSCLKEFLQRAPSKFDLRKASLGNLVFAGAYLAQERQIEPVVDLFASLVRAQGKVVPVADADLHVLATLEDGSEVAGQHRFTGKEEPPVTSAIQSLSLIDGLMTRRTASISCSPSVQSFLETADLIVFPMGSFYSSVLCQLLPSGVGRSIVKARCPKVFIPSMGRDPEIIDTPMPHLVEQLVSTVRTDAAKASVTDVLNVVLVDSSDGCYAMELEQERIQGLGVETMDVSLTGDNGWICPEKLSRVLLSLAQKNPYET